MALNPSCEAAVVVGLETFARPYCKMKPPDIPIWFNQTFIKKLRNSSCWQFYLKQCMPPPKGHFQENHHTTTITVIVFVFLILGLVILFFVFNRHWRFGHIVSNVVRKRFSQNKMNNEKLSRQSAQCSYRMDTPEGT
uniref:Uncharacterized protein n=1 Tax=Octopus bimaculoides TaxID=37653 RepID=A0A0L8IGM5_OCTBM